MEPLIIDGREYRRVSLDSDPLADVDERATELERIMRVRPAAYHERSLFVRTPNGNLVQRVSR